MVAFGGTSGDHVRMDVELELLATGYGLMEGPRTDAEGTLWFSDARGGTVHRRDRDGTIETVVEGRDSVGGLALHADGGLVMSGPNVAHWRDGDFRVLLELPGVRSFNDLHTDAAGRVYVGAIRAELTDLRSEPDDKGSFTASTLTARRPSSTAMSESRTESDSHLTVRSCITSIRPVVGYGSTTSTPMVKFHSGATSAVWRSSVASPTGCVSMPMATCGWLTSLVVESPTSTPPEC